MKNLFYVLLTLSLTCSSAFGHDGPEGLQERFISAVKANDVDAIMALYVADAVFFPVDDMMGSGTEYIRNSWQGFFSGVKVIEAEFVDTHEEMFGDSAVSWGMWKMTVVPAGSTEAVQMQGRFMDLSRSIDGTWMYIADHASVHSPTPPTE